MNKKPAIIVFGFLGLIGGIGYGIGVGLDAAAVLSLSVGLFGIVSGFKLYG